MTRSSKPKTEIDAGGKYHTALAKAEGGGQYEYDSTLTAEGCRRSGVRDMKGLFICYVCQPDEPHVWSSGVVCTELFLSATNTYRVVFNAQQCNLCNRYGRLKVDVNKYVNKVLDTFALWTGQREAYEDVGTHKGMVEHDSSRCHGCLKGICTKSEAFVNRARSKKNRRRRR
ncbi:hypothetical protein BGW39_001750 [Mortierella sp. 14UC]|nr:hypothetical protein BGW39_001750 [Mortierella sp. 14UC]